MAKSERRSKKSGMGRPVPAGVVPSSENADNEQPAAIRRGKTSFPIVGIGASAGGLDAFESFFAAMPADSGMAFILVAHLDPDHASLLPQLLQKRLDMPVLQAQDGVQVEPNSVHVIPPNKELRISNGALQLTDLSQPRGFNLPIDIFFRTLAQDQGCNAVCIILSGTGTDGTLGLKAIKGEAGMAMVQTEESAKYDGMPRSAIATGLADFVLPPGQMPEQLIRYTRHSAQAALSPAATALSPAANTMQKIFLALRSRTGHDFSLYKTNTICRRIERRMHVHQINTVEEYVRFLEGSDREARLLFKDLLIGVTSFFRDPEAFEALKHKALLKLLRNKPQDGTIRVWVPGCATGEEAYSIGILVHECLDELKLHLNVQIFGTDIDEAAISAARVGLYPTSIVTDVEPGRLARFFVKENDGQYRIRKSIREMLVFALQNTITDPPFTKLDLLSCRNLLIYLGAELQRKLLPLFHYSLSPDGVLFLGSSETIGHATDLFSTSDRKWKIFRRKAAASAHHVVLAQPTGSSPAKQQQHHLPAPNGKAEEISALQLVETILQQSTTPPCVIVDSSYNVIYIHGRTGMFLEPAEGKTSVNIVDMARSGLKRELTTALHKASHERREVTCRGLKVQQNGSTNLTDLTVKPILGQRPHQGLLMVTLKEVTSAATDADGVARGAATRTVASVEQELERTRENLQTAIEELETSNEELKSTNEELQSTNEELQSTNEELETSKEELQSLNEESATVNAELQSRIDELSKTNDDMKNLLDSTGVAAIFLDSMLRVRRFTPKATDIIPLTGADIGRPIVHFSSNLVDVDLIAHAEAVLDDLVPKQLKVTDRAAHSYNMRVRPYRTLQNLINGVVITFEDVTMIETVIREQLRIFQSIVDTVREPLLVLDQELRVIAASRSFYQTFAVAAEHTVGQLIYELGDRQWDIPQLRTLLEEILPNDGVLEDFIVEQHFPEIGKRTMYLNARRMYNTEESGLVDRSLILLAIEEQPDD